MLATAWQQAQEDEEALGPLSRAADLSDDGELDYRLALSYANLARWEDCVAAARQSLERGLDRRDSAQLTLGNCLVELERYGPARDAFQAAARDDRSADTAQQWIQYIDEEVARQRQLEAALN